LAAAHAEAGDLAKAVEYQQRANELYTGSNDRRAGELLLKFYQMGRPWRDVQFAGTQ
jgi:hypothetical protein